MGEEEYLSIVNDVITFCPGFVLEPSSDVHCLLDQLLKSLVEESSKTMKMNLIYFLEFKSCILCEEIGDIELLLATLKNVCKSCLGSQAIQGQCLISGTTILLEASEKFLGAEFDRLLTQHVNILLDYVNQSNCNENVYVRSVSADSLGEVELCYPLLLKPCLENIYAVTVKELSVAHQQYTSLLSLMMKHSSASSQLGIPLWNTYPQLVFNSKFLSENNSAVVSSVHSNNQLVSFLVDQLPFCNPEGVVWITNHIVEMLLHNTELRASCQVLKPLFFSCIYTFNCAIFHLLLYLEKVFGRELFEEEEHSLLLKQLLLNCNHPSLSSSIQLVYLDLLSDYICRMCHQLKSIQDIQMVLPNHFDEPDIQLKKFILLSNILKHKNGSSKFLLHVANNMRKQVKHNKGFKCKSVLIKGLFKFLCDYEDVPNEDITRLMVLATTEDVSITPFILHFIRQIQISFPASQLPALILSSLVNVYTQPNEQVTVERLTFVVDIFQEAVSNKCVIDCVKSILTYLYKRILCTVVCKSLSWSLGHKILKLCYSVMKEYNNTSFFYELNNVLQGFISKCENDDVQDRAQLYLCLLQSLSDKKLKAVLQGPRQALPRTLADDNSFHSQSCFQKLDTSIVYLCKVNQSLSCAETFKYVKDCGEDIVTSYKNFVQSNSSCRKLVVRISLKISQEYQYLDCIEALAILMEPPNDWGKIEPMLVGHFKEDPLSLHQTSYENNIICYPQYPQPTQVYVRAEFSLDNISHTCSLKPFAIEFLDFFCVLPVCDDVIATGNFFDLLWNVLKNEFQSVVVLECPEAEARAIVKQKLYKFIIGEDSQGYHMGIYLPPGKHLLMRYNFQSSKTIVKFVTDYIYILSWTNVLFKEFV